MFSVLEKFYVKKVDVLPLFGLDVINLVPSLSFHTVEERVKGVNTVTFGFLELLFPNECLNKNFLEGVDLTRITVEVGV